MKSIFPYCIDAGTADFTIWSNTKLPGTFLTVFVQDTEEFSPFAKVVSDATKEEIHGQHKTCKDVRKTQVQPCESLHGSPDEPRWTHLLQEAKGWFMEETALAWSQSDYINSRYRLHGDFAFKPELSN